MCCEHFRQRDSNTCSSVRPQWDFTVLLEQQRISISLSAPRQKTLSDCALQYEWYMRVMCTSLRSHLRIYSATIQSSVTIRPAAICISTFLHVSVKQQLLK